jgi:hypothetical protein
MVEHWMDVFGIRTIDTGRWPPLTTTSLSEGPKAGAHKA